MAAHRYWRVYFNAAQTSTWASLANVEFREVAGGPSVTTGGTAIASSQYDGGFVPANAFDASLATRWASNAAPPGQWVGYDFGAGNAKDIVEFALTALNDAQYLSQSPKDIDLQYSDDGSIWYTTKTLVGLPAWTVGEVRTWPVSVPAATPHRHWRLLFRVNNTPNSNVSVSEVQFRETLGGPNVAVGGVATASSTYDSNNTPAMAFDGNTSTTWHTVNGAGSYAWLAYDLGAGVERAVSQVMIRDRGDTIQSPRDFDLQWSDDGTTWTTAIAVGGATWAGGETKQFPADPGTHRYWRLYVTAIDDAGAGYCGLSELEFFPVGSATDALNTNMSMAQAGDGAVGGPGNAVDNNQGSECGSHFGIGYYWWQVDLGVGGDKSFDRISIRSQRIIPRRAPKDFRLEWSDDNATWTTQASKTAQSNWAEYERREFTMLSRIVDGIALVSGEPASGRTVRVYKRTTGALLVSGTTDTNGNFSLDASDTGELQVIVLDDTAGVVYNDLIHRVAAV